MQQTYHNISPFQISTVTDSADIVDCHIAVFAHNESANIENALASIKRAITGISARVYVLVNGCTDNTADLVKQNKSDLESLCVLETSFGDKANAWNLFVHEVLGEKATDKHVLGKNSVCIFMDGDVTCEQNTLRFLAEEFTRIQRAEAVGAMPATGRDRDAWRQRMVPANMLAGNCYALRGQFVKYLQKKQIRIPIGLIGEDFFVSWLVIHNNWRDDYLENEGARCVFHSKAEFSFRSLSLLRISDYRLYIRRKWRYTLRDIQHQMLTQYLAFHPHHIPQNTIELYKLSQIPGRLQFRGVDSLFWFLAVTKIRKQINEPDPQ